MIVSQLNKNSELFSSIELLTNIYDMIYVYDICV